jgi:hypothetical protein
VIAFAVLFLKKPGGPAPMAGAPVLHAPVPPAHSHPRIIPAPAA